VEADVGGTDGTDGRAAAVEMDVDWVVELVVVDGAGWCGGADEG